MTEPILPPPPAVPPASSSGSEGESLCRHAGIVTFFTLLCRILGMVRDLAVSRRLRATQATDASVQAFRIPNALRHLIAKSFMTIAFIAACVEPRE